MPHSVQQSLFYVYGMREMIQILVSQYRLLWTTVHEYVRSQCQCLDDGSDVIGADFNHEFVNVYTSRLLSA